MRLFALYAVASLIPVVVLGFVLASSFRSETNQSGLSEARSEARLIAQTAIEPLLAGHPLATGLTATEQAQLRRVTAHVIARRDVLRLRLRDLAGHVVFSDDGSGFGGRPDDEALAAAAGRVVTRLTHLNSDSNDSGDSGIETVEAYLPLRAGEPARRVGVLEIYIPYAPISRDIASGLNRLYVQLVAGLLVLYLVLFAITASVSRGLRRHAALNAFLAEHDVLTELPNRTLFRRRAAAAIAGAAEAGRSVAIAVTDLDRFKDINDTLGHESGDVVLTEIARRLEANMRPGDLVARLGGDEFGLIIRDLDDAAPVLWRLLEVIDREVEVSGLALSAQASLGFAIAPDDGIDADELLQHADVAMYTAKAHHLGLLRYDPTLDRHDAATLALVSQLRRAIDDDQLVLHYQPQATPTDRRAHSVEALVRWQHPEHGLLYPDSFLPLAEQTDVIDKLTTWVLRAALTGVRSLADVEPQLCVAVNVSARTICRTSFADEVIGILDELGMPGSRLIVEVTETALLADPERAAAVLATLAGAGVGVSLDDFGRGQTSLGYLSALPLDELKIDRSFVTDLADNAAHAAIVRSVVDLGHNLDLRVVAEGVETDEVLDRLAGVGCDLAQGFLLARPMTLDALGPWLIASRSPTTSRTQG